MRWENITGTYWLVINKANNRGQVFDVKNSKLESILETLK
jgi:hypothetical protein